MFHKCLLAMVTGIEVQVGFVLEQDDDGGSEKRDWGQ